MKTISIFLALINSLIAGLILASSLSRAELHLAPVWWSLLKMGASAAVILAAFVTWRVSARAANPPVMAVCSLFLVALGAATTVWSFHLALARGDLAFHLVVYGASLVVQGMTSLFGFAGDSPSWTSL